MRGLICSIILFWNAILATLARPFGLFFGGIWVGLRQGFRDQDDMIKYLKYKRHQIEKQLKEKEDERKDS